MKMCENCPRTKPLCVSCSMSECNITKEDLYQQICDTLQILYSKNYYLIEHEVNEVCLSTHFWHYFKLNYSDLYKGYDIDPEYNRSGDDPKKYANQTGDTLNCAKPDMIIHKRGCNKYNFAYFEFKTFWNNDKTGKANDIKKLKAFTSSSELFIYKGRPYSYNYVHGIYIILYPDKAEIYWYSNGKCENDNPCKWSYSR